MTNPRSAGPLWAGAARIDITATTEQVEDAPLFSRAEPSAATDQLCAKALVLKDRTTHVVLITVDAVAIAEIGTIGNDFLPRLRARIQQELGIEPANVLVNASHCHGVVCQDLEERAFLAVTRALSNMVPVLVGAGSGREDRIMENRRLRLKNGREADVRRAYALPPDELIASIGPVDPQIGILRLEREEGGILAVLFNFACHPIQGVPSAGNTADLSGFACKVIEDQVGDGAIAFFLQGCGADINPQLYRDLDNPPDAEPLGTMLGLSTLQALRTIRCCDQGPLQLINESLALPRADLTAGIQALRIEQKQLLKSLRGTNLNLKSFVPLLVKYELSGEYPSYDAHRYLFQQRMGRDGLRILDRHNRQSLDHYIANIHIMEELTRIQTNLALLEKNQILNQTAGEDSITVEVVGLRIGAFVLIAFPGELPVQIGLGIKSRSPHPFTFVAGVSNGYIYYAPTAEQLRNIGHAQEDSDCLLSPEWQPLFEQEVTDILQRL
ncbi:MAG: hypothetical protein VX733_10110 [Candidatus Latescibacterota bacterium]|nr:hypothetical protein [Candidatus Latescibacterota bacterium]